MALRLTGDHDRVVAEQALDQRLVAAPERLPLEVVLDLGPEHRVVLGERVVALRLEVERRRAGDRVEEERLLDRRHERVTEPPEHRVVRPDRELVLTAVRERSRVVAQVLFRVGRVEPEPLRGGRVDAPTPGFDVLGAHDGERLRMAPRLVDEEDAVEDLERLVRVQRRDDLRQRAQVAVDELAEPARVVERGRSRPAGDEQLEAGRAERVLDVDGDECDAKVVLRGRRDSVLCAPALRVRRAGCVVDAPHLPDTVGVPVRRQRERLEHGA